MSKALDVTIREIENGLLVYHAGDKKPRFYESLEDAIGSDGDLLDSIIERMGEGEALDEDPLLPHVRAIVEKAWRADGWLPPDEVERRKQDCIECRKEKDHCLTSQAQRIEELERTATREHVDNLVDRIGKHEVEDKAKARQLAKLTQELAEANERVEELEALRLPTPAGTRLQEAYENQTETIIRLNKHIKELQAELTSRYSPCHCTVGPIEPMEDAPRDGQWDCCMIDSDDYIKFIDESGCDIGFARIRRENLEVTTDPETKLDRQMLGGSK